LKEFPLQGEVKYHGVEMKYRDNTEMVLRGANFEVRAGEKVGIVGRTGAGKSSLLQALFRITELTQGQILIDGTDIHTLGLHTLRRNLSFIP